MEKLAVYGTLRNGKRPKYRIKDVSLVYPGHERFPAIIKNKEGKGAVVEIIDVDDADLMSYDKYESIDTGLYTREKVNVYYDDEEPFTEAWVYVAGPSLMQHQSVFKEVPRQDWLNR
tara:strand:- start:3386 stop:3736 length:351 start_codon:yes stop_codon:yes gene_type:complete